MASAFDGLGLGQMGFERQFMTGDNPLREALKGVKTGLILQGLEKSGLRGLLNPSPGQAIAPPQQTESANVGPVAPTAVQNFAPAPTETPNLHDELDKEWGLQSSSTYTSPNTFKPSPTATDTSMLQMASQAAPPPGNLNLPQYGKKQGGGGLDIAMKILPMIFGV